VTARQQRPFVPSGKPLFTEKALVCGFVFVDSVVDPAQGSLKSDRGSPAPARAAKKPPMRNPSEDQ
jgi:hypothetical protein